MKPILVALMILSLFGCSSQLKQVEESANLGPVLKISVFQSGKVLADGSEVTLDQLGERLKKHKEANGIVWYYREAGQQEPPPIAMEVLKLVVDNQLAISMSSKPDFSDAIDMNGRSHPRK